LNIKSKIIKCVECIKKVKERVTRLFNKEQDGVDPKNDNSRAIALRYDNMRRMMTSDFLKFS
jgi:hypothetical protein